MRTESKSSKMQLSNISIKTATKLVVGSWITISYFFYTLYKNMR